MREIAFLRRFGDTYLDVRDAGGRTRLVDARSLGAEPAEFPAAALVQAVRDGTGGVALLDVAVIQEYDNYYYSRTGGRPLPVVRVKVVDPEETWVYLDPSRAEVAAVYSRTGRIERWLYHGLHSLDVPFLYRRPSLSYVVVIALCVGGAALSTTGLVAGIKRLLGRRSRLSRPQ